MLKKTLRIVGIFLVFVLIAFRFNFGCTRANHTLTMANTRQVALGVGRLKVELSSPRPYRANHHCPERG